MTLFTAPTVAALAEQIVALQAGDHRLDVPPIQPVPREGPVLASFAQEPFWFVQQMSPSATILNMHGRPAADRRPGRGGPAGHDQRDHSAPRIAAHDVLDDGRGRADAGHRAVHARSTCPSKTLAICRSRSGGPRCAICSRQEASEPFDLENKPPLRVRLAAAGRQGTRLAVDDPPRRLRRLVAGRARPRGGPDLRRHAFRPAVAAAAAADPICRLTPSGSGITCRAKSWSRSWATGATSWKGWSRWNCRPIGRGG